MQLNNAAPCLGVLASEKRKIRRGKKVVNGAHGPCWSAAAREGTAFPVFCALGRVGHKFTAALAVGSRSSPMRKNQSATTPSMTTNKACDDRFQSFQAGATDGFVRA